MPTFNTASQIKSMIELTDTQDAAKAALMVPMIAEFGEDALLPTKFGGLNGSAFREDAKTETRQAEANKVGLTLDQAESLARIMRELNASRPSGWQDYQIAHFGLERIKPKKEQKAPSAEDLEIKAIIADRKLIAEDKAKVSAALKIAKAELTLAKAQGDKAAESAAQTEVTALEQDRDLHKADLDEKKAELDELRGGKKSAPLHDAAQALLERLKKSKLLDNVGSMTLNEIIAAL